MDYKELKWNCEARSEIFRTRRNEAGAMHEEQCSRAITDLLARAEAAEAEIKELKQELSDAAKVVKTIQENTLPFYKNRAEAAESAQETLRRTMVEYKARAEKAEKERDGAVSWAQKYTKSIDRPCVACKHNTGDYVCTAICGNCGPMGTESCKWEFDFSGELKED